MLWDGELMEWWLRKILIKRYFSQIFAPWITIYCWENPLMVWKVLNNDNDNFLFLFFIIFNNNKIRPVDWLILHLSLLLTLILFICFFFKNAQFKL